MNPLIEIVISPDGATRIETKGFTGPSCRQASEFLEQALGERKSERLTGEFHCSAQSEQRNKHHS